MADYKDQGLYQEGNSLFDDIFAFGDLEVQNVNVLGIITATTFSGVDATSLKDDGGTVKIQATTTGATHSGRAVFNEVELQGKVYDSDGDLVQVDKFYHQMELILNGSMQVLYLLDLQRKLV